MKSMFIILLQGKIFNKTQGEASFFASNCTIGSGAKLSNCILWPNTHIGNNSILNASFLGYNVKIGNNCNLCENCLFTNDCLVKDNTQLTKRGVYVPSIIRKEQTKVYLLSLK